MRTKTKPPEECLSEMSEAILREFPHLELTVHRRNERDYTIEVWGGMDIELDRFGRIYSLVTDMLVDSDVWIVVLRLPSRSSN